MNLAQVSYQYVSAAMPAIGWSSGIVGFLLVISGVILRWKRLLALAKRVLLRQAQYDYRKIFQEYLERFNRITDRRELYPAVLSVTGKVIGARGSSLIVRDSSGAFQMKASCGLKPFGFDLHKVLPFLDWLEANRKVVTRQALVGSREFGKIKSEGICYFVQMNADVCVPLFLNDKLYGVINLGEREKGAYDAETRDLLGLLAVQFAIAIHNANLYQVLIAQNLKLQEASKFKTQLLSNLSHELRTPLSGIIGLSGLMAEGADGALNDEQKRHAEIIKASGQRLFNTVTAMLDLSKLEVNRTDLNVQKVNLGRLAAKAADSFRLNGAVKFDIRMNGGTPGVYGDEKWIGRIFSHLIDNAVKFTKEGMVSVSAEKCGEMLKVCVADTGCGIPPEKQKMVFDGFSQADGSLTREHEGLGIGLAISKKLVELHGGRMWLKSKVDKGSNFYFTLPLKPAGVFTGKAPTARH